MEEERIKSKIWVYVYAGGKEVRSIFFFNDTATTEIYTLSLHDALPISISNALNINDLHPDFERLSSHIQMPI